MPPGIGFAEAAAICDGGLNALAALRRGVSIRIWSRLLAGAFSTAQNTVINYSPARGHCRFGRN
jgi:hypothetical protein